LQDYFLSEHFAQKFGTDLRGSVSHTFIARTCISYLFYFGNQPLDEETLPNYPLATHAATQWCYHLLRSCDPGSLLPAAMQLLEDGSPQYSALVYLLQKFAPQRGTPASPLHLCCQEGYIEGAHSLLANTDINLEGHEGTPLVVASGKGHINIVRLLLQSGADVNVGGGIYGGALASASRGGFFEVVYLLLDHGADLETQGSRAMKYASEGGHADIVALLEENGAVEDT
jgi:ankyrin repeat protein